MLFKKSGGVSYIVVFLGNPGKKYERSRHNAGFMTAAEFEKKNKVKISRAKFDALTASCNIGADKVFLMKPQTYMNLSGRAVRQAAQFYKTPADRIIVVCDDMDLPVGRLRIRPKGSSGGHKGLGSIISALGTEEFPRIKIGIDSPADKGADEDAVINWVLGGFSQAEAREIALCCARAADAVSRIIGSGIDSAMNEFN